MGINSDRKEQSVIGLTVSVTAGASCERKPV